MFRLLLVLSLVAVLVACDRLARRTGLRRGLLLVAVVLALLLGSAFRVHERVGDLLAGEPKTPYAFPDAGDVGHLEALRARPEDPFPGGDAAEARRWQERTRTKVRELLRLPKPEARVTHEVQGTEELDRVLRMRIAYEGGDGVRLPGFLLMPRTAGVRKPVPGVLVVPGHGAGAIETAGFVKSYQNRAALALAQAGYATLTPELRGFGALGPPAHPEHRLVAHNALLGGGCYKALVLKDLQRALSVLRERPEVDARRIAVVGASLGGEIALTLAAVDLRVHVVVVQSFGQWTGPWSGAARRTRLGGLGDVPHGCHLIPGINRVVWQEDWYRLVAPRPLLSVRGAGDWFEGPKFRSTVTEVYKLLGASGGFAMRKMSGGHEFFVEPAVEFLEQHLK